MIEYNAPRYLFRRYSLLNKVIGGEKFLEVGAGNLKLSSELTKYFKKGVAVDFEESIQNHYDSFPQPIRNRLTFKKGDFAKLGMDTDFDCVVSCEVMEHIENDKAFLENIYSLIKNNGQVIISVPAKQKYWTIHDEAVGHYRRYEKKDLEEIFKQRGFGDIQVYSYGFPFINTLWLLRALHGRMQHKSKKNWSIEERTKASGVKQEPKITKLLGVVANKYVFYIPNRMARFFEKFNLSEGYIIVAYKAGDEQT